MSDYRMDHVRIAKELWEAATGKPPAGGDDRWGAFVSAVQERNKVTAADALVRAKVAVSCYQPIPEDGMTATYRAAFNGTRKGCEEAVNDLRGEVQRW